MITFRQFIESTKVSKKLLKNPPSGLTDMNKQNGGWRARMAWIKNKPPVKRKEVIKETVSIRQHDGEKVAIHKNPSPSAAARLHMNSKEGFARYFAHGDGNIHMWSGDHSYEHSQFMHDHGVHDSEYHGAGVTHSADHAHKVADNHRKARREAKGKPVVYEDKK